MFASRPPPPISAAHERRITRNVTVLDLVVLLGNVFRGLADNTVGYEDTKLPLDTLVRHLNRRVKVWLRDLEPALWACNLLDEKGDFWHPKGVTFDRWISTMLPYDKFDKLYNLVEEKNG